MHCSTAPSCEPSASQALHATARSRGRAAGYVMPWDDSLLRDGSPTARAGHATSPLTPPYKSPPLNARAFTKELPPSLDSPTNHHGSPPIRHGLRFAESPSHSPKHSLYAESPLPRGSPVSRGSPTSRGSASLHPLSPLERDQMERDGPPTFREHTNLVSFANTPTWYQRGVLP